jgi:hypothetical protein
VAAVAVGRSEAPGVGDAAAATTTVPCEVASILIQDSEIKAFKYPIFSF